MMGSLHFVVCSKHSVVSMLCAEGSVHFGEFSLQRALCCGGLCVVRSVHFGECARRHALLSQVTHAEQPTALSLCTILLQAFTAGSYCRLLQAGKCDTE